MQSPPKISCRFLRTLAPRPVRSAQTTWLAKSTGSTTSADRNPQCRPPAPRDSLSDPAASPPDPSGVERAGRQAPQDLGCALACPPRRPSVATSPPPPRDWCSPTIAPTAPRLRPPPCVATLALPPCISWLVFWLGLPPQRFSIPSLNSFGVASPTSDSGVRKAAVAWGSDDPAPSTTPLRPPRCAAPTTNGIIPC